MRLQEGSGYGAGAGETSEAGGGGGGYEFGVDPNLDPELALALRVSLEEERARLGGQAGEPNGHCVACVPSPMTPSHFSLPLPSEASHTSGYERCRLACCVVG